MYSYYHTKFPNNLLYGAHVCPVEYYTRKYDFSTPVPKPFKYDSNNYVVCIPSHLSHEWTTTWKEEGIECRFTYREELDDYKIEDKSILEEVSSQGGYTMTNYYVMTTD